MLDTIKTMEQLNSNLEKSEFYLNQIGGSDREEMVGLIQRGRCFVVYSDKNGIRRFVPAKYLGYVINDVSKHIGYIHKGRDGRIARPCIETVFDDTKFVESNELNEEYINYCNYLGVTPNNFVHKFIDKDLFDIK